MTAIPRPGVTQASHQPPMPSCHGDWWQFGKHRMARLYDSRKRILVTGGAGFLGSHLCDRLLAAGHEVLCVDNLFTGTKRNIEHLHGHPRFEFMRHDVTFPLYVEVDEIYNLACPASPIHYQHDPVQTTKTVGAWRHQHAGPGQAPEMPHLPGLDQRGLRRSQRPPADRGLLGQRQSDRHRAPATTRASAAPRRCSSTITASTASTSRSRASSTPTARACTRTTGASCRTSSCRRCSGEPITIYGDGQQTRSFCYVDDLIEGLIRLMDTPKRRSPARSTSAIPASSRSASWPRRFSTRPGRTIEAGLPAAARRRPEPAPAGHHPGTRAPGLAAAHPAGGGPEADHRLFPAAGKRIACSGRDGRPPQSATPDRILRTPAIRMPWSVPVAIMLKP